MSTVRLPDDQLNRTISHEPDAEWPDSMEIVAKWPKLTKSFKIEKDQFFGTGAHGAPISGDALITVIDRLRRKPPSVVGPAA